MPEEFNGFGHREAITEDQSFGQGVNPVGAVVRNHAFTPDKWIATVMARAIEQLAKVHVKVAQEGIEAIHITERNTQVTPIFFGP